MDSSRNNCDCNDQDLLQAGVLDWNKEPVKLSINTLKSILMACRFYVLSIDFEMLFLQITPCKHDIQGLNQP